MCLKECNPKFLKSCFVLIFLLIFLRFVLNLLSVSLACTLLPVFVVNKKGCRGVLKASLTNSFEFLYSIMFQKIFFYIYIHLSKTRHF